MSHLALLVGLISKRQTLAFAESCTAGLTCATFAQLSGVSAVLKESVITYSNEAKHRRLGVPTAILETFGAVSKEVVTYMAKGIITYANADLGIAISGVAGPTGGTQEKPVGLVWFGLEYIGHQVQESKVFQGDRQAIQTQAASHALHLAYELFKSVNQA